MSLWIPFGGLVLAEIGYPLASGETRAALVVVTVALGYALSVAHAFSTRGVRAGAALVGVTTGGGFAIEAVGRATGLPFGVYDYTDLLGPRLLGVPVAIPLAWTWMAWPAWSAAGRLTSSTAARVAVAGVGLAAWDLFLDPQMVAEGYWRWADPDPALPGVPDVPIGNYAGWLAVSVLLMALLALLGGAPLRSAGASDDPMLALYLWTYGSSVLAHAVFLGMPASAGWGAIGMGLVAAPLAWRLRPRPRPRSHPGPAG